MHIMRLNWHTKILRRLLKCGEECGEKVLCSGGEILKDQVVKCGQIMGAL